MRTQITVMQNFCGKCPQKVTPKVLSCFQGTSRVDRKDSVLRGSYWWVNGVVRTLRLYEALFMVHHSI